MKWNGEKIKICIMSSGRANKQITIKQIPKEFRSCVDICTTRKELKRYQRALPDWHVIAPPRDVPPTIGPQRQWYMESVDARFLMMMDDDLTLLGRDKDMRLSPLDESGVSGMMSMFLEETYAGHVALIGISSRNGNNRVTEPYVEVARAMQFQFVDMDVYRKIGCSFAQSGLVLMEDLHVVLHFLEHGYKNRVYYCYALGSGGSNTKGGCSQYRDAELQAASARRMAELHPGIIDVVRKKTKASWQGFEKDADGFIHRTDVIIHWKKAYRPRREKSKGISRFF